MPPTLTEDHLKTCLSKRSGKLDNSKEFNFACKLWCNLQKRSVTGIAEKDQTKISFLNKPSQQSKPIISSKPIQASQASQEWTHVVGCFWLQFSTFAAVCCCLLQIAACRFLLCDIVCCCLPLLLPLARFARNFNPNTMAKMSQKLENCSKMNLKWSWKWLRGAPWGPGETMRASSVTRVASLIPLWSIRGSLWDPKASQNPSQNAPLAEICVRRDVSFAILAATVVFSAFSFHFSTLWIEKSKKKSPCCCTSCRHFLPFQNHAFYRLPCMWSVFLGMC